MHVCTVSLSSTGTSTPIGVLTCNVCSKLIREMDCRSHFDQSNGVCVCVSVSIWAQRGKQAMRTSRQTRERASEPKIKGAAHPNVTLYVNQTSIAGISNYWWEEKRQNDVVCLWPVQQPRQASWGFSSPCNKQFTQLKTWCHTHTHKSVARTWHTG